MKCGQECPHFFYIRKHAATYKETSVYHRSGNGVVTEIVEENGKVKTENEKRKQESGIGYKPKRKTLHFAMQRLFLFAEWDYLRIPNSLMIAR